VSDVYEFQPHGQQFAVPVTIEIAFDTTLAGSNYTDLGVYRYDDIDTADGIWQQMAGATFAGGIATFDTSEFSWYAVAQLTPPGGELAGSLLVNSVADMEAFCAQYTSVEQDLTIGPAVVSTEALDCLEEVGGTFSVAGANSLTALSLPALTTVGDRVNLMDAPALTSISLPVLATMGAVWIFDVPVLTSVSMPAVTTFGRWTTANMGLTTLQGITFPATLTDAVQLEGDSLASLGDAFAGTTAGQDVLLGTSALTDTEGLSSLQFAELLSMSGNLITSFDGLASLQSATWIVAFNQTELLTTTLPGSVTDLGAFSIDTCPQITELGALGSVTVLPGRLEILNNPTLTDISALQTLTSIGTLQIENNPNFSQASINAFIAAVGPGNIGTQEISNNGP
jgi:hypothetical protein